MTRWTIALGAATFGVVFVLALLLHEPLSGTGGLRIGVSVFLFAFYVGIVIFGTTLGKRAFGLVAQTILGVLAALAIAATLGLGLEGLAMAAVLGLILGFTADVWAQHVQLP